MIYALFDRDPIFGLVCVLLHLLLGRAVRVVRVALLAIVLRAVIPAIWQLCEGTVESALDPHPVTVPEIALATSAANSSKKPSSFHHPQVPALGATAGVAVLYLPTINHETLEAASPDVSCTPSQLSLRVAVRPQPLSRFTQTAHLRCQPLATAYGKCREGITTCRLHA